MKYLLIALAITAISAEIFDTTKTDLDNVDDFLQIEMTLPCTPKQCKPVCKLVTKYVQYGAYKLPYQENVCVPDKKCLADAAACIAKLQAAMKAAEAAEKDMIAKAKLANAAKATKAQKDAAAAAKKKEEAAAASAMAAAKAAFEVAEKEAAAANAASVSAASTSKSRNADMAKALAKYEAVKKLHLAAQAAYAGAKSAAAAASAAYNAAVKAHCDAEAVHAAAVTAIGHGQFKKDECKKYENAGKAPSSSKPVAGKGVGSGCGMHDKHNNQAKISGTSCGSGYHGCTLKSGKKMGSKGGCCSNGGFHRRCHCAKTVDCKAMCNKDSGCLGWVNANHGCQWATISDAC